MKNEIQLFDPLVTQVTQFVSPANQIKVTDNSSASDAVETGNRVKSYQKEIEALRKELVGPLNDQVKLINEYAKKITAPLDQTERYLKGQIAAFEDEQAKRRAVEMRRIEAEREAERQLLEAKAAAEKLDAEPGQELAIGAAKEVEMQAVNAQLKREERAVEATAISNIRRPWKAEVLNEAVIPREYLTVDMKKINAAVKLHVRTIPGVRIFQETTIAFGKTTAVPTAAIADDYFGGSNE